MPASPDSPMKKDLHDCLQGYAEQDSVRECRLGRSLPGELTFYLSGGHVLGPVYLLDGENSLDDESVEVTHRPDLAPGPYGDQTTTIAIAHIAAFSHRYPKEAK